MSKDNILNIAENNTKPLESKEKFEVNTLEQGNNVEVLTKPIGGDITSRLMNTKIVRIHPGTACACVKSFSKLIFSINTISRRDDTNPNNENEIPLFYVEENIHCDFCCSSCHPYEITFQLFDSNTRQLFSVSDVRNPPSKSDECCEETYYILPNIHNYKPNNIKDEAVINTHDSRSVYRTYEYMEQIYYKIGKPYVKEKDPNCCEACLFCLAACCPCFGVCICDKSDKPINLNEGCCCCNKGIGEIDDNRQYIDIFNMNDEAVGKFALYFNKGILCQKDELFYEIYFPPDANEMVRLALIGQILCFHKIGSYFGVLPGSRDNLNQFTN